MLPERSLLNVVDETNRREIHIAVFACLDRTFSCDSLGGWCISERPFSWDLHRFADRMRDLGGSEYIWEKRVVVKTPNPMRASRLERVIEDKRTNELKVSMLMSDEHPSNSLAALRTVE